MTVGQESTSVGPTNSDGWLTDSDGWVYRMAFSPDGRRIVLFGGLVGGRR